MDGHVTIEIGGEASKGRRRGVVGSMGACMWGTGKWRKEKDMSVGISKHNYQVWR